MSKNRPFVVNCDMMCKQNDREEADKMNLDIVGRIRKENEKRGWTVYRLAKEANLSPSTFLYGQDDLIHLNAEQKRHLDRWNLLTEKQQRAVELFIDGLNQIG